MNTCNSCKYWENAIYWNAEKYSAEVIENIGTCKRHEYLDRYDAIQALKEGKPAFAPVDDSYYYADLITRGDIFSCNQYEAK